MNIIKKIVCGFIITVLFGISSLPFVGAVKAYQYKLTQYQMIDPSATKIPLSEGFEVLMLAAISLFGYMISTTIIPEILEKFDLMDWESTHVDDEIKSDTDDHNTYESYITELREDLTKLQTIRDSINDVDLKRTLNDILINIEKTIDNISPAEYKMQTFNSFHNVLLPEFIKITASAASLQKDRHKNNIKETYDKVVDVIKKSVLAFENIYAKSCEDDLNSANINASAFSSYLNTINNPFELKV